MKKLFSTLFALTLGVASAAQPANWVVAQHDYRGFPLFIRYPNNLDYDKLQPRFPIRIVATIELTEVKDNGLPVSSYNNSLESFDNFVVEYFEKRAEGQCVLVETFGGKRQFYIYVSDSTDTAAFEKAIKQQFPQHSVTFEIERDAKWSLIRRYAKEYMDGD